MLNETDLRAQLDQLPERDLVALKWRLGWLDVARPNQIIPEGDPAWNIWMGLAGRGWGKTKTAAEDSGWWAWQNPGTITHIVAPTQSDLRGVCFEGQSGLLNTIPAECLGPSGYNKSFHELTLANGSIIRGFSAEKPDRLRGPQCHRLWGDELAAWDKPAGKAQEVFDMAMFGLRLGNKSRAVFTTTPKPIPLIRDLIRRKDVRIVSGSTYDNLANLSENFRQQILQYEGTQIGRQEIYAEVLDPSEFGIIKRGWFGIYPAYKEKKPNPLPRFDMILMSLDTAFTDDTFDRKKQDPDFTACSVWGLYASSTSAGRKVMLLDRWADRLGVDDLVKRVQEEAAAEYGNPGREVDVILIENTGAGISLRQMLRKIDFRVDFVNPTEDKLARLHAVSPLMRHGLITLPESSKREGEPRDWCEPLLDQMCLFHGEGTLEHDDEMDAATQALSWFAKRGLIQVAYDPHAVAESDTANTIRRAVNTYAGEARRLY